MYEFVFTKKSHKQFENPEKSTQTMIVEKLTQLKNEKLLFRNIKKLENLDPATHRIKIGSYRVLIEKDFPTTKQCLILKIGHRQEIYK